MIQRESKQANAGNSAAHRQSIFQRPLLALLLALSGAASAWDAPVNVEQARASNYCSVTLETGNRAALIKSLRSRVDADPGTYDSEQRAVAILVLAGIELSQTGFEECTTALQQGQVRYDRATRAATDLLKGKNRFRRARDKQIATIQRSIAEQWLKDQIARVAYVRLQTESRSGPEFWAFRLATADTLLIDRQSSELMHRVLSEWDWVDRARFGPKVSDFAWLLVQHADRDAALQSLALERMQTYLADGGIKPANYAYLRDRVAINSGRMQRYGTQPIWKCTPRGTLELHPVEHPEQLDARRAGLSMKPARLDLEQMAAGFCGSAATASER